MIDVQVDGNVAAALVDANGDGADMNVELYVRDSGGQWRAIASGNGDSIGITGVEAIRTSDDSLVLTRTKGDFE